MEAYTVFVLVSLLILNMDMGSSWSFTDVTTSAAVEGNLRTDEAKKPSAQSRNDSEKFLCPERCACSVQEKIIDCSSLGLNSIPKVPRKTSRLYLHSNRIEVLQPQALEDLHELTYLILSGNDITGIQPAAFSGLASLRYLILDNNNISTLHTDLFRNLKQLETISLARNQLETLPSRLFTHNNQVTLLNLQGNRLRTVESGAFLGLSQLSTLNLDNNLLDESIFEELKEHNHLTTLRLNGNEIKRLPVQGISLPALKYLSLQSNIISEVSSSLMTQCSTLETLILNQNAICKVSARVFIGCSNLTKLELRENLLESLPANVFLGLSNLKNLYLHKNDISHLSPGAFNGLRSLQALYLCYNKITEIPTKVFKRLNTLSTIHLEWNKITSLSQNSFVDLPALETIYLHRNGIKEIQPGTFVNLQKLKHLDLYNNQITFLKPGVLNVLHSLQRVQVDPLPCSCSLLHLTTWAKRRNIRGLICKREDNDRVYSIANLDKQCFGSRYNNSAVTSASLLNPSGDIATLTKPLKDRTHVQGPHKSQERKVLESRQKKLKPFSTSTTPKGPSYHKTSLEKVLLKLDEIQHSVVQLQFRLSRVENLLDKEINPRHTQVCLHERTRLEVGDKWLDGLRSCVCTDDGSVKCVPIY